MRRYAPVIIFQPVNPQPKPNPPNLFQTYKKQQNEEREKKKGVFHIRFPFLPSHRLKPLPSSSISLNKNHPIKSYDLFFLLSVKLIPINLISHHHHPKQKNRANNLKGKDCPPLLTDAIILQPSQCLLTLSG